jgi:hypothetical protein
MNKKDLIHFDMRGIPDNWKKAIERVYRSYPKESMPMGICDMAYICTTLAFELNLGDGKGKFRRIENV